MSKPCMLFIMLVVISARRSCQSVLGFSTPGKRGQGSVRAPASLVFLSPTLLCGPLRLVPPLRHPLHFLLVRHLMTNIAYRKCQSDDHQDRGRHLVVEIQENVLGVQSEGSLIVAEGEPCIVSYLMMECPCNQGLTFSV